MPPGRSSPPRVTRETRLLLVTALLSVIVLWGLARMRFPERSVSPNPLPPVLTQLAPRSPLEEIPALVAELTPRLAGWIARVEAQSPAAPAAAPPAAAAFRLRDDLAVLMLAGAPPGGTDGAVVVHDHASGLTVVRVAGGAAPDLPVWTPRRLDLPRFVLELDAGPGPVALRPVFVSALVPETSAAWRGAIWRLSGTAGLRPGTAAITPEGAVMGLVVPRGEDGAAIVPWPAVQARVEALLREPPSAPGRLGFDVQQLTPPIAAATGSAAGVIVTHVDADGPAAGALDPLDIIETADGTPVTSIDEWRGRIAGLAAGDRLALRVRRGGDVLDVTIAAAARDDEEPPAPFGAVLRTVNGTGAEVVRVAPASASARAGLRTGDVITAVGGIHAPTAPQVARAYTTQSGDRPLLLVVVRDGTPRVLALTRQP